MKSAEDWSQAYQSGRTPWDLWGATPALEILASAGFFARLGLAAGTRVGVPGCGRGHDLRLLSRLGFAVTGFDLAEGAVAEARQLLALNRVEATVLCRDVLGLLPEFENAFDLVYEYTCYCALPTHLRPAYARTIASTLAPGGYLLALAFPMQEHFAGTDGPPYLVREGDLAATIGARLELQQAFAPSVAGSPRADAERWFLWQKPVATESAAAAE